MKPSNQLNNNFLDLHLRVLKRLMNGHDFETIQIEFESEMEDLDYLETAENSLLTFHDGNLVGAYPISLNKTTYKVEIDEIGTGYAMCAIDALGVAYTFMRKTLLSTKFIDTENEFSVIIDPISDTFEISDSSAKILVTYTSPNQVSNIALQQCPSINFYEQTSRIPPGMQIMTFDEALASAKRQFSQTAILRCVNQSMTSDVIDTNFIDLEDIASGSNC